MPDPTLFGFTRPVKVRTLEAKAKAAWRNMLRRCEDPKCNSFYLYGARGISVHPAWHEFPRFLADVGLPPAYGREFSLERVDNSKNYEPGNVKWASAHEQSRNKRINIPITHDGETLILQDWANRYGINRDTLRSRLALGWPMGMALTTPVGHNNRHLRFNSNGTPKAGCDVAPTCWKKRPVSGVGSSRKRLCRTNGARGD